MGIHTFYKACKKNLNTWTYKFDHNIICMKFNTEGKCLEQTSILKATEPTQHIYGSNEATQGERLCLQVKPRYNNSGLKGRKGTKNSLVQHSTVEITIWLSCVLDTNLRNMLHLLVHPVR